MTPFPSRYGPSSPFDNEAQETIERIYWRVVEIEHEDSRALAELVVRRLENLEKLGEVLATYPSPLEEQRLGQLHRGLDSLVESLCSATPANLRPTSSSSFRPGPWWAGASTWPNAISTGSWGIFAARSSEAKRVNGCGSRPPGACACASIPSCRKKCSSTSPATRRCTGRHGNAR